MSFSFIVIDLEGKVDVGELQKLKIENDNYEILYCSPKSLNCENLVNYTVSGNEHIEEIVNGIMPKCKKDNIVLVHKFQNAEEIVKLTQKLTNENQIVCYKKKLNKIEKFFNKICKLYFEKVFKRNFKNIYFGCICFGKTASSVLKSLEFSSNLTRINEWTGIEYVILETEKKYALKYNLISSLSLTLTSLLVSIICFFLGITLKVDALFKVIFVLTGLSLLVLSFTFLMNWLYKKNIGDNITKKIDF